MGYDLHVHSIYSDGTFTPDELVQRAKGRGLSGIALTDHDTILGIPEAKAAAEQQQFTLIPGVELTTDYGETEVHILGYCFDMDSSELMPKLDTILEARRERARLMVEKLQRHNVDISWEQVLAKTTSGFVGRTHVFKVLESILKITPDKRRSTFDYYLGKNGMAYVPHREIDTFEAIHLINQAGGVSVLAHPGRMADDALIRVLVDTGLQGIEVYYPSHSEQEVRRYEQVAEKYDLVITGGSDFHGAFSQAKLGDAQIASISDLSSVRKVKAGISIN